MTSYCVYLLFKALGFRLQVFDLAKIALIDTRDVRHWTGTTTRATTTYTLRVVHHSQPTVDVDVPHPVRDLHNETAAYQ